MADRPVRRRARRSGPGWLVLATAVAFAGAAPVAALAAGGGAAGPRVVDPAAPAPGESCTDASIDPDASDVCRDVTGPGVANGGGGDLGFLLPVLGAAVAGAVLALIGAMVVMRRRPAGPLTAADPGEWWTCRSCGKSNVIGSARCYDCGTWQG